MAFFGATERRVKKTARNGAVFVTFLDSLVDERL